MPAPDYSGKYNTSLSADDETAFQGWLGKSGRQGDLSDYDLRGWWKSNGTQERLAIAAAARKNRP